jgi:ribonuclease HI|tara:strand:+ start:329 stop:739 length:411 start_codon:yes stop_codon:yes gene_type:complete
MINKVYVNADGGSRRNPGPSAIGVVIRDEDNSMLSKYKECIGEATNNVAEYRALIKALELVAKYTRYEVQVFMDSEFVIKQISGIYRIKAKHLYPLFQEVKNCERAFEKVTYNHVNRGSKFQIMADQLVNEALDER